MAEFEKPLSRSEAILQNILGADNELSAAQSRVEAILLSILSNTSYDETAQSRFEALLLAVKNGSSYDGDVGSRAEKILLAMVNGETYDDKPESRFEELLINWSNMELPIEYERVPGFALDADCYWKFSGITLNGNDTVRLSVSINAACNVFGCYTDSSATNNYSLYVSTTSGGKYLRYNGETYKSYWSPGDIGDRFDIVIAPTGSSGMPSGQNDSWSAKTFTGTADMCIGTTSSSATSSKLKGKLYGDFIVDGRFKGIPCKRLSDDALGYYDTYSRTFYEPKVGTPTVITS